MTSQLNLCGRCAGNGVLTCQECVCRRCGGQRQVQSSCLQCGSNGLVTCGRCRGQGATLGDRLAFFMASGRCRVCKGVGSLRCAGCAKGLVTVPCPECADKDSRPCNVCDKARRIACPDCVLTGFAGFVNDLSNLPISRRDQLPRHDNAYWTIQHVPFTYQSMSATQLVQVLRGVAAKGYSPSTIEASPFALTLSRKEGVKEDTVEVYRLGHDAFWVFKSRYQRVGTDDYDAWGSELNARALIT